LVALFPSISTTLLPGGGIYETLQSIFNSGGAV